MTFHLTAFRLLCAATSSIIALPALASDKPFQHVIISFDGAHDIAQWQRSLDLARRTGAEFTYFLNCAFALSPENKTRYNALGKGFGKSNVGFGKSKADVTTRLGYIWQAHLEGHEMASHTCGHFDGKAWTKAEWLSELTQFSTIMKEAWTLNGAASAPPGWAKMVDDITGFRAPYLSTNANMYAALGDLRFAYDASKIERDIHAPKQSGAITLFALPTIPEGPQGRRVIAMDYNLFVRHSAGFEKADANGVFETRTLQALNAAFEREYRGKRSPLQIGLHFTLMNGGAYWRAVEKFAADVCTRTDVKCISYRSFKALAPM
jgi:peptidoglycan/xylan/chitin deacetylase (PgdA/CDA1 family)